MVRMDKVVAVGIKPGGDGVVNLIVVVVKVIDIKGAIIQVL